MSAAFYTMQAEVLAARSQPKPPKRTGKRMLAIANTVYLLAAWHGYAEGGPYSGTGFWKIMRETADDEYKTEEIAQTKAEELGNFWTNIKIIKVELPAEIAP